MIAVAVHLPGPGEDHRDRTGLGPRRNGERAGQDRPVARPEGHLPLGHPRPPGGEDPADPVGDLHGVPRAHEQLVELGAGGPAEGAHPNRGNPGARHDERAYAPAAPRPDTQTSGNAQAWSPHAAGVRERIGDDVDVTDEVDGNRHVAVQRGDLLETGQSQDQPVALHVQFAHGSTSLGPSIPLRCGPHCESTPADEVPAASELAPNRAIVRFYRRKHDYRCGTAIRHVGGFHRCRYRSEVSWPSSSAGKPTDTTRTGAFRTTGARSQPRQPAPSRHTPGRGPGSGERPGRTR